MRKLDLAEKTNISGGIAFWTVAIAGSLIAQVVMSLVKMIGDWVMSANAGDSSQNNYHSTFSSTPAYLKVSKYPSQTNLRVGMPWM